MSQACCNSPSSLQFFSEILFFFFFFFFKENTSQHFWAWVPFVALALPKLYKRQNECELYYILRIIMHVYVVQEVIVWLIQLQKKRKKCL